jgi:hypothetical protein
MCSPTNPSFLQQVHLGIGRGTTGRRFALTPPTQVGYFFSRGLAIVATSVTNTSASAGAYPVVVLPISVLVSPDWASVALNGTQQFTATVNNDGTNRGVNWSLMQAVVACAPACDTITARTSDGAPATAPLRPS